MPKKNSRRLLKFSFMPAPLNHLAYNIRSGTLLATIWHHFWRIREDFERMLASLLYFLSDFRYKFGPSLGINKPPATKRNNGKRQEHADNFRNMQTSNARRNKSPKLRSRICKLQNAISCNKRPSPKKGGGGNRAAWRIQMLYCVG